LGLRFFFFLQVLKTYYGGREITPEDLKAALIVGMGPREHRRLMKKRFLRQQRNEDMDVKTQGLENSPQITDGEGSQVAKTSISNQMKDDDAQLPPSETDQAERSEVDQVGRSEVDQVEQNGGVPEEELQVGGSGSDEDIKSSTVEAEAPRRHSRRSINKESLLGHGPHGKQVVDMIIEKEGAEGIRQFCQVWRVVFVDALQPAFLPPGWDVTHRSASCACNLLACNLSKALKI
jgi:cation-transporting P-type ATPase D